LRGGSRGHKRLLGHNQRAKPEVKAEYEKEIPKELWAKTKALIKDEWRLALSTEDASRETHTTKKGG